MLTSVACSCVRNGRKISVPVARLSLVATVRGSAGGRDPSAARSLSRQRSSTLLTPTTWHLPAGLKVGSVSVSTASRGDADPPAASPVPEDRENFGSLSTDLASRRSFRKSSPYIQDLRHRDDDAREEEEDEQAEARRRPGRRNTPYWYFLQCKKLIRDNKVCPAEPSCNALAFFSRW